MNTLTSLKAKTKLPESSILLLSALKELMNATICDNQEWIEEAIGKSANVILKITGEKWNK